MKSELYNPKSKILVLVGPTSSGKSELAVKLAKKFDGEIISCDSRQIYKGLDLGTGKIPGRWHIALFHGREKVLYGYKGINHHLIDIVSPKIQFSSAQFQKAAQKAITDITLRGKLPILCGGTAHWVDAVVYDQELPDVKPNKKLRAKLEKQSTEKLYERLMKLDPTRAKTIDPHNPRRLIRALEIVITTGRAVPPLLARKGKGEVGSMSYDALWLGIKLPQPTLYRKIEARLKQRLKFGMIKEVANLRKSHLSWKRLESFGLEYRFISQYLQKKIGYEQMYAQLLYAIKHYSKRQLTWWKKNRQIKWLQPKTKDVNRLIFKFLRGN